MTLVVALVLGASLGAFSVVIYASFARALWRQFDARLLADAQAIANMVEERSQGLWEFEAGHFVDFDLPQGFAWYEVWMDDGTPLARSPSLAARDLPRDERGQDSAAVSMTFAEGRQARLLTAALPARLDDQGPAQPSGRRVIVAVARATEEVDSTLSSLSLVLTGSGLAVLAISLLAGIWAIRRGLMPIDRLNARVDAIDAHRLEERLPADQVPRELQLTVGKLNELLDRLGKEFAREKQFSADVSHELRTPLAGLRSVLDVAISRDRSPADYRAAIHTSLEIVAQMSRLIESLLTLCRLDAHRVEVNSEAFLLRGLIDERLLPLVPRAQQRRLRVDNRVAKNASVTSDRDKLAVIADNLLRNAVEYTSEQGTIVVNSDLSRGILLEIYDSGPAIPTGALPRIFDRFFRLEASRSAQGDHLGIGLTLTAALCEVLGLAVTAANAADGGVLFRVRFASGRSGESCPAGSCD